jgi:hypothetical protein
MGVHKDCPSRGHEHHCYYGHSKAFIPHVVPRGLGLTFDKNSSGALEVFFYNQANWDLMIDRVDRLEGFCIEYPWEYGYVRTLVAVNLLPKNFQSIFYEQNRLDGERNLDIDPDTFLEYPIIPAWIYSNYETNVGLKQIQKTILWDRS